MDGILLSDLERYYLIQGAELGCRMDGRAPNEYRPIELETKILSHANGSASVRIGETFIICCVKMEVGRPLITNPNEGRVEINVECYPTATCSCNEKSASELAECLKTTLQSAYQSEFLNLHSLCIQSGRQCWIAYIDILILEGAGNLLDASSLAIKAALIDATKPNRMIADKNMELNKSVEFLFDANILPILTTIHKIGASYIVDASKEEEACSLSRLSVVIYPDGSLGSFVQQGCGSCQLDTITEMTKLAVTIGKELHQTLLKTLELESQLYS